MFIYLKLQSIVKTGIGGDGERIHPKQNAKYDKKAKNENECVKGLLFSSKSRVIETIGEINKVASRGNLKTKPKNIVEESQKEQGVVCFSTHHL
jgi:hypothetical protein